MLKSMIFLTGTAVFLNVTPLVAEDYSQGTGQAGCYFGQCPEDKPDVVDEVPNNPNPLPDWQSKFAPHVFPVDRCWVDGAEIFTFSNSQIHNFNLPNSYIGFVRHPAADWQCALDLIPNNGVGYCVLNQSSGLVFRGGPPNKGGVQAGYCARCNVVGC